VQVVQEEESAGAGACPEPLCTALAALAAICPHRSRSVMWNALFAPQLGDQDAIVAMRRRKPERPCICPSISPTSPPTNSAL